MPASDSRTVALARELIRRPSVTPRDEGCCELIASRLEPLSFRTEIMPFGEVTTLWAVREGGLPGPTLELAGHTAV
ncbi:MAG: succinyl-diaminopimelate desuccinylase, partial [Burkholderiaceae bacterium]